MGRGEFRGFKGVSWSFYPVEQGLFSASSLNQTFHLTPSGHSDENIFPFYFYLICFFFSFCGNFFHFCSCCLFCRSSSNKRIFFSSPLTLGNFPGLHATPRFHHQKTSASVCFHDFLCFSSSSAPVFISFSSLLSLFHIS